MIEYNKYSSLHDIICVLIFWLYNNLILSSVSSLDSFWYIFIFWFALSLLKYIIIFVKIFIWFSSLNNREITYEFIPSIGHTSKDGEGNIDAVGNEIE